MTNEENALQRKATHIAQFKVFDHLTYTEHEIIIGGWANGSSAYEIAKFINKPQTLVKAYYGVRDLMFYESECLPKYKDY